MSNHSHLHETKIDGKTVSIDAFGTRDACAECRQAAGLPSIAQVKEQMAARGVDVTQLKGGAEPAEQLLADLEAAEATIDELRATIRSGDPAMTRERDDALAEAAQLKRQLHALEQQLQAEREKSASLEQSLAAAKPKR